MARADVEPKAVPTAYKLLSQTVIGYIALDRFTKTASREVENALKVDAYRRGKGRDS